MTRARPYDVVVIGSGPGGYVAAIRAAQLGLKTACIERAELGGICLNWGCIPTKALLRSAEVLEHVRSTRRSSASSSASVEPTSRAIIERSRGIADKVSKGVAFLFKKNKIDSIAGTAKLLPRAGAWKPHQIEVTRPTASASLETKHVILATGARARSLPGIELDGKRIIEYRKAMTLPEQPKSMVVLGAGAIGVEFASFYRALGTEVTIVEFLPRLVPNEDPEISKELGARVRQARHQVARRPQADGARRTPATRSRSPSSPQARRRQGRRSRPTSCSSPSASQRTPRTSASRRTASSSSAATSRSTPRTAAATACGRSATSIGRGLAHVASAEGVFVAEKIAGVHAEPVRYDAIPACTYCHPEIASVGLTEEKAKAQNIPVKVGKFPFRALAKARAAGDTTGFVKVLWHAETGALVGAHLIGPAVTDLIAELTLAKTTEVNAESLLVYTIHAHPTFAEAIKGATEAALGHAIDL